MIGHIEKLMQVATCSPKRIVLAEGEDERVVEAAILAEKYQIAEIILLGDENNISSMLDERGANSKIKVINPVKHSRLESYIEQYIQIRGHRIGGVDEATATISHPLGFAAMMVRMGDADGTIAGALATSADTIKAAIRIIGKAETAELVSSFFLMYPKGDVGPFKERIIFADCALVVDPNEHELADIAINTSHSAKAFLDEEPKVAMLSFSTLGSATHPRTETVRKAVGIVKKICPELEIEGEIQFDAAIDSHIRQRKAPNSRLSGTPNVFIFPGLDAANIGYKIAQRLGGMTAVGPVLQGLAKPANDLSRGCTASDILSLIAVTSIQATSSQTTRG